MLERGIIDASETAWEVQVLVTCCSRDLADKVL
jgi:hypothetical protein